MNTSARTTALTAAAILVLLGGSTAAFANTPAISVQAQGGVINLGNQVYTVAGGQLVYSAIDGQSFDAGARISYGFEATQNGQSVTGHGIIRITGTIGGVSTVVSGTFPIDSSLGTTQIGQGVLSAYFVSSTPNIVITSGGQTQQLQAALVIENPYFNPFGAPIAIFSTDGSIAIAATYSLGTIYWSGSQVEAGLAGTDGSTPVSGVMTLTGNELENLVAGTAADLGTTAWTQMTPASLDTSGTYVGTDTIPYVADIPGGPNDCTAIIQDPIPGTCTLTGFQSTGTYHTPIVHGSYSTAWGVPALTFTTTLTGNPNQNQNGQGNNGFFQALLAMFRF